jgi:hypothetical protein
MGQLERRSNIQPTISSCRRDITGIFTRYLCAYLVNRVAQTDPGRFDLGRMAVFFRSRLRNEASSFVVREILVTMVSLGIKVTDEEIDNHLKNPIPDEKIRAELRDYYGSIEEARNYLRDTLSSPVEISAYMRMFYLISLVSICTDEDVPLLRFLSENGNRFEKQIAKNGIDLATKQLT